MARFARLPITDAVLACLVGASIVVGDHAVAVRKAEVESLVAELLAAPALTVSPGGAPLEITAADLFTLAAGSVLALRFLAWSVEVASWALLASWIDVDGIPSLPRILAWLVPFALAAAIVLTDAHTSLGGETPVPRPTGDPARFVDAPLLGFDFRGRAVFLTTADLVAMSSGVIILVRFLAWSLAPVAGLARRRRPPPRSDA